MTHPDATITEHTFRGDDHTTFYLASGPVDGPLLIFVHGWPELSLSWRHQLPVFGALGFRAIAPDLRGYGRSSVYERHEDYALEQIVGDMLALLEHLGQEAAVWVGHDWGSPVVWSIASHHPERCDGVASLCVPYAALEGGLEGLIALVDREVYPEDKYPAGRWDYMLFYQENFEAARRFFEANPYNTAKLLFRKGDPEQRGQPALTAAVRAQGGWFGGAPEAPDLPQDSDVVSVEDLCAYASALERNGFFGPDSYYMNHAANSDYARRSVNGGHLEMPVLFLAARYDFVCETIDSRMAEPQRDYCKRLTEHVVPSGHWMAQERPVEVNNALCRWLATELAERWPTAALSSR